MLAISPDGKDLAFISEINEQFVGDFTEGDKVVILETSNGWGKTDKGWISMQYAYKSGTTGTNIYFKLGK